MKRQKETSLDNLQRILDIIAVGAEPPENGVPCQFFGIGPGSLSVIGAEAILEFDQLVTSLQSVDPEISQSYSRTSFTDKLIDFIRSKKLSGVRPTQEEVREFYSELKAVEINEFRVLREIFGINLRDNDRILRLGNFEIFHFPSHKTKFERLLRAQLELMIGRHEPEYMIEYRVRAREQDRAIEIADNYFRKFVLYVRYIIGTTDRRYEVGILDFRGWNVRNVHVIHGNHYLGGATEGYGSFGPVTLDDPHFVKPEGGFDKLWVSVDNPKLSKLQKRICTAVEWVGKSLLSADVHTAFVEASVAIESILTRHENAIITPSILNQISESVAFIVGNSSDERIAVEKDIKELYSARSGIVHAGNKEVTTKQYVLFIKYVGLVIARLLTDKAFEKCATVEQLYHHLKCLKYS